MLSLLIFAIWWCIGLLSAIGCLALDWRRGEDITVANIFAGLIVSLLGPILVIWLLLDWLDSNGSKVANFRIIKGRKRR